MRDHAEERDILTRANVLENGRPLSFANIQMRRETDAKILNAAKKITIAINAVSTFVADREPVAP